MEKGYLYIATGEKYIKEAIQSVQSLKKQNDKVHATLITDKHIKAHEFDDIIIQNNVAREGWKEGLLFKVSGLLLTPYEKTFFVDTDTYFSDDCLELFELLDYYDLLIAHAPSDTSQIVIDNQEVFPGYYPYNTGVIVFNNNDAVKKLIKNWLTIYQEKFRIYRYDQTPFMESLLYSKVRVYVLQPVYNFRTPFLVPIPRSLKVKIFHGRVSDFESFQRKINYALVHRVWIPAARIIIYSNIRSVVKYLIIKKTPNSLIRVYKKIKNLTKYKRH